MKLIEESSQPRSFEKPEALEAEGGRFRDILMELRNSGFPYSLNGIDASVEVMNVVNHNRKGNEQH